MACSDSLPELELRAVQGRVNLAKQVPGDWDQICLLTPYTASVTAGEFTGLSALEVAEIGIADADDFNALFFMRGDQVFAAYQVSRDRIDFDYTQAQCFPKSEAELKVR